MSIYHPENNDQFNTLINLPICIIDYYADWCNPCKVISPEFERIAVGYPNTTFVKINVDKSGVQCDDVSTLPTFRIYKNGKMLAVMHGCDKKELNEFCKKHCL